MRKNAWKLGIIAVLILFLAITVSCKKETADSFYVLKGGDLKTVTDLWEKFELKGELEGKTQQEIAFYTSRLMIYVNVLEFFGSLSDNYIKAILMEELKDNGNRSHGSEYITLFGTNEKYKGRAEKLAKWYNEYKQSLNGGA